MIARLHKYVALAVGALVALMGLSGSALVFRPTLEGIFHPERIVTPAAGAQASFERVMQAARTAAPQADTYTINAPDDPRRAFLVTTAPEGRRLFIDPYSGKVITDTGESELAFDWLMQLHIHLLAGDVGTYFVAAIGVVLFFLGVTGVILWWPRKWKNALRVRWNGGRLALNYDLHKVGGAIFSLLFLLAAVTGVVMAFPGPAAKLVGTLAGNPPVAPPKLAAQDAARSGRASLDQVVQAAIGVFPEGRVKRVVVGMRHVPVLVRMQVPGNHHPNGLNRVYLDPHDASVVGTLRLATASPGNRMLDWLYPLHMGRLFGTVHQSLQVAIGLAPTLMLVTGLIVWWQGRTARKRRPAPQPARAQLAGKS